MNNKELQDRSTSRFSAKIIADSVNIAGNRLTTFELTYPRCIHSEIMTHRMFSKNAASSRAIPVKKLINEVRESPFIPFHWGKNQEGMQAYSELDDDSVEKCRSEWIKSSQNAADSVENLVDAGLHKQIANRILEPYMFITVVLSTTSFKHFEQLRNHHAAEPHLQYLAILMTKARNNSTPKLLVDGEWHLPYVRDEDKHLSLENQIKVSVARCARVSYVRQNEIVEYAKDFALYDRLVGSDPKHSSPTEHQAVPYLDTDFVSAGLMGEYENIIPVQCGNFLGWKQHRKFLQNEFVKD